MGGSAVEEQRVPSYRTVILDGRAKAIAEEVRAFYDLAIVPAVEASAASLEALPRRESGAAMNRWESARTVQMEAHKSFV